MGRRGQKRTEIWIAGFLLLCVAAIALYPQRRDSERSDKPLTPPTSSANSVASSGLADPVRSVVNRASSPSPYAVVRHDRWPSDLPSWLIEAIDLGETPAGPVYQNRNSSVGRSFDPRHLAVLQDIIDLNRLEESSARWDYDNGDGILDPLELGFQLWVAGELVALSFGADPYSSFGYQLDALPPSLGDLHRLRFLDVQSNRLSELPIEIGLLLELRELRAHRNQLSELPESFSQLTNLRGIHLSRNHLSELPESISRLTRLEWLHLGDNPLTALPQNLGDLHHLRSLWLQNTGIDPGRPDVAFSGSSDGLAILPETLESLMELELLYVSGNHLGCSDGSAQRLVTESPSRVFGLSAQRCAP